MDRRRFLGLAAASGLGATLSGLIEDSAEAAAVWGSVTVWNWRPLDWRGWLFNGWVVLTAAWLGAPALRRALNDAKAVLTQARAHLLERTAWRL